jgi:hypothetical protein
MPVIKFDALTFEFVAIYISLIIGISFENKIKNPLYKIIRILITIMLVTFIYAYCLVYLPFSLNSSLNITGTRYAVLIIGLLLSYFIIKNIMRFIDDKQNSQTKVTRKKR